VSWCLVALLPSPAGKTWLARPLLPCPAGSCSPQSNHNTASQSHQHLHNALCHAKKHSVNRNSNNCAITDLLTSGSSASIWFSWMSSVVRKLNTTSCISHTLLMQDIRASVTHSLIYTRLRHTRTHIHTHTHTHTKTFTNRQRTNCEVLPISCHYLPCQRTDQWTYGTSLRQPAFLCHPATTQHSVTHFRSNTNR